MNTGATMGVGTQKSGALGKGLASLLPGAASAGVPAANAAVTGQAVAHAPVAAAIPGITHLSVDDIQANEYQPRRSFEDQPLDELAQSIRVNGLIQPLVVRRVGSGYQLIAGERRLRASKLAGLKLVPVVVKRATDKEALELALIENIQRENLNCIDEAQAYQQLMHEFQLAQEEVAQRVGKDRATVSNFLRLLRLPEAIMDDLKKGALSLGHGKALLMVDDPDARLLLRKQIIEGRLSVRQAEALAQRAKLAGAAAQTQLAAAGASAAGRLDPVQSRLQALSQSLTRIWSAKVEVKGGRKRGKIVLQYDSAEQLERILAAMQNSPPWQAPATSP